jgi:hypothetical protein
VERQEFSFLIISIHTVLKIAKKNCPGKQFTKLQKYHLNTFKNCRKSFHGNSFKNCKKISMETLLKIAVNVSREKINKIAKIS